MANKIQTQITDISWIPGTINRTNISNACSTEILTFSTSINNITASTFGYLSNVTSNIQQQINTVSSNLANLGNNPLVLSSSLNVAGMTTLTQAQVNLSLSVLQNISFVGMLNNITASTFAFLANVSSDIQQQINTLIKFQ